MNEHVRLLSMFFGLLFTFVNIYLLVRKRVGEKNTLFWLIVSLVALLISFFPQTLTALATFVGVDYPPSLLYLIAILVLLVFSLVQSMQIFTLQKKLEQVTRELSMVRFYVDKEEDK